MANNCFKSFDEEVECRDDFARAALTGMLSVVRVNLSDSDVRKIAEAAYQLADAMLEARQKDRR